MAPDKPGAYKIDFTITNVTGNSPAGSLLYKENALATLSRTFSE